MYSCCVPLLPFGVGYLVSHHISACTRPCPNESQAWAGLQPTKATRSDRRPDYRSVFRRPVRKNRCSFAFGRDDTNSTSVPELKRAGLEEASRDMVGEWRSGGRWEVQPDEAFLHGVVDTPLEELMAAAAAVRDQREDSELVTFSPKVFIPLTRLCRDSCGYCTFAAPPSPGQRSFMSLEEVLEVARQGVEAGCTEALFTLGDKPELLYSQAREELSALGYSSTLEYLAAAAGAVLAETGLVPHVNAGVMGRASVAALRKVSGSQGLMLESASLRLMEPGQPHYNCPDKHPAARLATIAAAGKEKVPFTSGILIGIGETRMERIEALLEIRKLHKEYGHIQELIIQNFRAKKGTLMAGAPEPPLEELLWTIAVARLAFGPEMSIQAPPNLTPSHSSGAGGQAEWAALIGAGINDFGGISPVTRDWVNPEARWPQLAVLAEGAAAGRKMLAPRLPVYRRYCHAGGEGADWLDAAVLPKVLAASDASGLARAQDWSPGLLLPPPALLPVLAVYAGEEPRQAAAGEPGEEPSTTGRVAEGEGSRGGDSRGTVRWGEGLARQVAVGADGVIWGVGGRVPATWGRASDKERGGRNQGAVAGREEGEILDMIQRATAGEDLTEAEVTRLLEARGPAFAEICHSANELRRHVCGEEVTYVVNRNINYTNVCTYKCAFCAFSKGKMAEDLRGKPYLLPLSEIGRRAREAWERGASEVCMQGGIHPDFTGQSYLDILGSVKAAAPHIHVHAFSPLEVLHGAETLGISVEKFLVELKAAGLGSLPGTAAEVLDDRIRQIICPDKLTSAQWLEVIETAHAVGLRTTSTIMFGHVDGPQSWATHLLRLRDLQKRTGGITEFVPLPFVHMQAPIFLKGRARKGPTMREAVLMHAVARLVLHPHITNIQASWVKMGPGGAQALLAAGCNDMGGSLMNESITRAAGAAYGQELPPTEMVELIRGVGRIPKQRTTLYGTPPLEQVERSLAPATLAPLQMHSEART